MDSILTSIKKMLGIEASYEHFDADIIMHINSAFVVLQQLGVGPKNAYRITSDAETWDDFFGETEDIEMVKSYVYLKVKMMFDPPLGSTVMDAYNKQIAEFEWRLNSAADYNPNEGE